MRKTKPKIVVIGAGSASFGLSNLSAILRTPELHGSTLSLCDLNDEGLDQVVRLARRMSGEWGSNVTIESSTDRCALLPGADFVILSVAIDREACWRADHELGQKYGLIHYAENGGPGGFFHAARNITLLLPVLRDVERLAPNAIVLNFTNPLSRICTAAARYTRLTTVGICHQLDFGYMMAGRILGSALGLRVDDKYLFRWANTSGEHDIAEVAKQRLDIKAAGINHFTWFLSIRDRETGEELLPQFFKLFLAQTEFEPYTRAIIETFGQCPTSGDAHFLEYVPYTGNMSKGGWQHYDIQMYPMADRAALRDVIWARISGMASGELPIDELKNVHTERAEQIIAAIWEGTSLLDYAVNMPNTSGQIANLPRDAIVETPAVLNQHGIQPISMGELPRVPAALCARQLDIVELAVRAAAEGDKNLALQALALDPMVDDLRMARGLLDDGLKLFSKYLPQF